MQDVRDGFSVASVVIRSLLGPLSSRSGGRQATATEPEQPFVEGSKRPEADGQPVNKSAPFSAVLSVR